VVLTTTMRGEVATREAESSTTIGTEALAIGASRGIITEMTVSADEYK
jgi:hypothetical protein